MNKLARFFNFATRGWKKALTTRGECTGEFKIGVAVALNSALIDHTGGVEIGDRVHFGHEVMLLSCSHPADVSDGLIRRRTIECKKIVIRDDVCIGSRALILPGVTIGKGAYVAAGAIVTKNVRAHTLVGGNPAKFIRNI